MINPVNRMFLTFVFHWTFNFLYAHSTFGFLSTVPSSSFVYSSSQVVNFFMLYFYA